MPSAETTARMFIGISLPVPLRETLANVAQHLKANYVKAGNWSRSDLYHVTLVFLGEIDESQRNIVELIAEEIATRHEPGSLTLTSVGAFPKGRILWSGIDVEEERKWGRLASQLADRIRDETGLSIQRLSGSHHAGAKISHTD